jgi:hypothetical protein
VLKFVLVVALLAGLIYMVLWTVEQRRAGRPPQPRAGRRSGARPVAPDDDEDFLRWLDRRRRRKDD